MSESKHVLSVKTDDELTEIAVYDGNLNVVAKAAGGLDQTLPAGLYRVRIRVGSSTNETLAALDRDRTVKFDQVPFSSPIPLRNTANTHEYHMAAASAASQGPRKRLGTGASIMVFAREWSAEGNKSTANPAEGLSLLDSRENLLAEIGKEADQNKDRDASAGWSADVNPGGYFLRLELDDADKTTLVRPIYVSPGHQLQIFCLMGNHIVEESGKRRTVRRADLAAAAAVVSPSGSFNPDDRLDRLSELACHALTQSRGVVSQPFIDDLIADKFDNPMLGLFGAHLLLRERPDDKQLFRTVTDNLLRLLGPDHPDLRALWWQRDDNNPIGDGRLHFLPMLRASWSLAVERSIKTLDVFSLGTFYDKLPRIVPSAPWLMLLDNDWAVPDAAIDDYIKARASANKSISRAEARDALKRQAFLKHYARRVYSVARDLLPTAVASYLPILSDDVASSREPPPSGRQLESAAPAPEISMSVLKSNEKADLARTLAIPREMLETILKRKGQ